jgi:5-methylcytosine-specific restriction endonuclease McrA
VSDRNLSTSRSQVFGDVAVGTECRVCGRPVDDGRAKFCSDYCRDICRAVMNLLNWSSVRRRVIERDDETCQRCGLDYALVRRARDHIRERIETRVPDRVDGPSMLALGEGDVEVDWDDIYEWNERRREYREVLKDRYGDPYECEIDLEVDHITRVADGGHPFDPANLQTLCSRCHQAKTSVENSTAEPDEATRPETPLTEFLLSGGDSV